MSSSPPQPDSAPRPARTLPLVWIVPVVAVIVAAWLIHREFRQQGMLINIHFADGAGIEAGKTPLMHKGVEVGHVTSVALTPDLDGVDVQVELADHAGPLAVAGSEFWLVQPEIGFGGVRGLETLVRGTHLGVRAGSGAPQDRFEALPKAPPAAGEAEGRRFWLTTDHLGSLNPGTAVYFRGIKVGAVATARLNDDATGVMVEVNVFEPYYRLVRPQTKFWNAGGLDMKVGLLGAQLHSNSLESLVAGGIAFATPDDAADAPLAEPGTVFELQEEEEKSWLKWAPSIPFLDQLTGSADAAGEEEPDETAGSEEN